MSAHPLELDDVAVVVSCPEHPLALESLLPAIQRVVQHFKLPARVYLLDHRTREETRRIAEANNVTVIPVGDPGYGSVISAAMVSTRENYLVTLDGDGIHPPELLPFMYSLRDRFDVVIASRYVPQGYARMQWWRLVLSRALNEAFRHMLGLPFRDLSSSYRQYRRSLLTAAEPSLTTDAALQEILIKTYCEGYAVAELPMHYIARGGGRGRGFARLMRLGVDYLVTFAAMWRLRNSIDSCDYDTRAFFSRIPLQRWWQRRRYDIVSSAVGGAMRVLDAGCGSTQLMNRLPQVIGMDFSIRKLRYMRRPGRRLVNGSTFALPFRSGAFDVVISSQVIEHLPDDVRIFNELTRCLAPGGTLVLGTVDYGRWQWPLIERIYAMVKPTGYAHEHITHYTHSSLTDRLRSVGLNIERVRYICGGEIIITAKKPGPVEDLPSTRVPSCDPRAVPQ